METIENIFPTNDELIKNLKDLAKQPDYEKILFSHLGPELRKIFESKKDKVIYKNFFEGLQYEYGFFGKEKDLSKALSIYKKYADLNDYFCMYKMHVIYLCEYEKFQVPFNRVMEKLYLLKCLAYSPNYVYDWGLKFFDSIDIKAEMTEVVNLEDTNLDKHPLFLDMLNYQREKYNLSENDIILMKETFICFFTNPENKDNITLSFITLNSLIQKSDFDYAFYNAKNRCVYLRSCFKFEQLISEEEIENFYKEITNKKIYEFYCDYGNYILDKKISSDLEIIDLFSVAGNMGHLFARFRHFEAIIDYYDFNDLKEDFDKICTLLDCLLDQIVFENLEFRRFILSFGFLYKYSTISEKICSKYLVYVKEIYDYICLNINKKDSGEELISGEDDFFYAIKSYFYFYGFKGIEEQNLLKSIEYIDKATNITEKINTKKANAFFKYHIKKLMYSNKLISDDELNKEKKDLIDLINKNISLKFEITDCYIVGKDYFEGITKKKDLFNTLAIYKASQKIFCKNIIECYLKSQIKIFVKEHDCKIEIKVKDEICGICYDRKVEKIFIPCRHNFCSFCAEKLKKEFKCPMCRSEILSIE